MAHSRRLSGQVNLIILSLLSLLWQLPALSQQPLQLAVESQDKASVENSPPAPSARPAPLPCLDSNTECIGQLSLAAIANSPELKTLDEQIALIDQRIELMGDRLDYTSKKRWTNYLTLDPLRLIANIAGGGDVQRDNIAIADLEASKAELEAYRANLERRKSELAQKLRGEVTDLVLDYEAAVREETLAQSRLDTYNQRLSLIEVGYRLGEGSTEGMLSLWQQREELKAQIIKTNTQQLTTLQKLKELTGFEVLQGKRRNEPE